MELFGLKIMTVKKYDEDILRVTTPTKEQSLDIERAMGFEIPWYRIEEIIIRWEKIRNSPK